MTYELRGVGLAFGAAARALDGIGLSLGTGSCVSVVGPNGAGKSTLLGVLAGLRQATAGECLFEGRAIGDWPRREFARKVAFVAQVAPVEFPFTAEQVVAMGRVPYADGFFESDRDHAVVDEAMRITDTLRFRGRDLRSLSGGERQRVIVASALAQEPRVLLLDEPATFLDIKHQLSVYQLLRELARERGLLTVAVTHDLNLARRYSDRVVVLDQGRLVADGAPEPTLTRELLREVFAVEAEVTPRWIAYES